MNRKLLLPIFSILLASGFFSQIDQARAAVWDIEFVNQITEIAQKTYVDVEMVSRFEGMGQSRELPRSISGMIVSSTGLVMVLQNVEVITRMGSAFSLSRPEKIQILFPDRRRIPGRYIGMDPDLNVSFFEIDPPGDEPYNGAFLDFAAHEVEVGEEVASCRMLSEEYEPRFDVGFAHVSTILTKPKESYMTQPPLSQFNGNPAFNKKGEVVGVVLADDGSAESAALSMLTGQIAIQPANRYTRMIENPPTKVEKGWLGIRMEPLTQDLSEIWKIDGPGGIIVTSTVKGSPAETHGLRAEDVIVAIDGEPLPVRTYPDLDWFRQKVRDLKPGDHLAIKIVRGASSFGAEPVETKTIDLELGVSPPSETEAESLTLPEVGMKIRALTLDVLFARRLPETMGGVVADYVENAGPADIGELKEDDIILSISGNEVTDLESAAALFADFRKEKPKELIFHVLRGNSRLFLKVEPNWE
ncbi:MAG: PDZ domain-containing protein [Candidatus Omnitrophica bacterium]|nr:PDZ domain-containing protein [Candidatus Omnitrophota bacterium]MCA9434165.1 PDZ domain-containing protein [Candidatus Omnitrophota bacterium]MCB9768971.1 PDZ domain-containing protein [Candidatus Omnitrophota bacterium]MCB9782431.1 PDZ domain-containing protein [Candidatus Omnitrophota bacterium]